MNGYSPKLPLLKTPDDSTYGLNKTFAEMIRQNLKMLLLTNPGERIMDKNFGVGLRTYLFSQDTNEVRGDIQAKINEQISKYLSYVVIEEMIFNTAGTSIDNVLFISIKYSVPSLNINDELNIPV